MQALVPDQNHSLYHDSKSNAPRSFFQAQPFLVAHMQKDIASQIEAVRALDIPQEQLLSGRQPFFSHMNLDGPPLSPRQLAQDDSRRPSLAEPPRQGVFRAPVPPHLAISPRRFGSIGGSNPSPAYNRSPQPPPQPPPPHPLSSVSSPPGLARRHTSADIREHLPGWSGSGMSNYNSGNASAQWPSSPNRTPNPGDQQVREVLAQYEMGAPRRQYASGPGTPPLTNDTTGSSNLSVDSGWSFGPPKFPRGFEHSAPATRRSSMASNVHSLLNPAETVERDNEDEDMNDDRKRKRIQ